MPDLSFLPAVNASLNALATVLLVAGYVAIRRRRIETHTRLMLAAFACSILFLISYVTHYVWRAQVVGGTHTHFNAAGLVRWLYYALLLSHVLLAMAVPFLAVALIRLGLRRQDARHRRLARWGFPVWLYVSVTGVVIYVLLYHLNPPAAG